MPNGYAGRILWIDLTSGEIREEIPDDRFYRKYIGGRGIGAWTLLKNQAAGVDALGPDNILGFTAGLLVGFLPGATRCSIVTKSPLTDGWGDASVGGPLATKLKQSGFDAVFIKGIAPHPVYLTLIDGKAMLHDARHLWGKGTRETLALLATEAPGIRPGIACYRSGRREPLADRRDRYDPGGGGPWRTWGSHGGKAAQGNRRARLDQGRGGGRLAGQGAAKGDLQATQYQPDDAVGEVSRPGHLRGL